MGREGARGGRGMRVCGANKTNTTVAEGHKTPSSIDMDHVQPHAHMFIDIPDSQS